MCGVTNPPVTPPPFPSARPTVDSQQETGQDRRTKEKGGGGRGVCGSVDHVVLGAREERFKTQEIAGETKTPKHKTRPPTHPRTTGKTPGKRGKGTQPTQRKEEPQRRGRGKTRQGEPHPPRRKKEKAPLGQEEPEKTRIDKISGGMPRLIKGGKLEADPRQGVTVLAASLWGAKPPQSVDKNKHHNTRKTKQILRLLSSCSCR